MFLKQLFLFVIGASFGLLAAAGVFTVLTAVGLVPRFVGKTHTAKKIFLYENAVILGTIIGGLVSVFPQYSQLGAALQLLLPEWSGLWPSVGVLLQIIIGLFSGMFVGCVALAIAEMLDSIPILTRRIAFRHGISLVILSVALGKLGGSLLFFWKELHK